jgi:hypothetical protein
MTRLSAQPNVPAAEGSAGATAKKADTKTIKTMNFEKALEGAKGLGEFCNW